MSSYRELVFMVLDQLKISSDDSYFDVPHIVWLINKYRALLIQRSYNEQRKVIPEHIYQTVCLEMEPDESCIKEGINIISIHKVPDLLTLNDGIRVHIHPIASPFDYPEWTYILPERYPFTGHNKYLKKIVYFTILGGYLYAKSFDSSFQYIKQVQLIGLFNNPTEVNKKEYLCNGTVECDPLDLPVYLEEYLIPPLLEMIIKDLIPQVYRPEDKTNTASDLTPEMAQNVRK